MKKLNENLWIIYVNNRYWGYLNLHVHFVFIICFEILELLQYMCKFTTKLNKIYLSFFFGLFPKKLKIQIMLHFTIVYSSVKTKSMVSWHSGKTRTLKSISSNISIYPADVWFWEPIKGWNTRHWNKIAFSGTSL